MRNSVNKKMINDLVDAEPRKLYMSGAILYMALCWDIYVTYANYNFIYVMGVDG